jgi:uncharacterized membrane protein
VHIVLWVVQVLLAVFFAFAAFGMLTGQQSAVEQFDEIGFGQWFRYLTGTLELAGAIGLLIPRLSGLAALGLIGVMVGAVFVHLFVLPPAVMALAPATFIVVLGLIAWGRWPQTRALAGQFKR